jgi:hypothetical protein
LIFTIWLNNFNIIACLHHFTERGVPVPDIWVVMSLYFRSIHFVSFYDFSIGFWNWFDSVFCLFYILLSINKWLPNNILFASAKQKMSTDSSMLEFIWLNFSTYIFKSSQYLYNEADYEWSYINMPQYVI